MIASISTAISASKAGRTQPASTTSTGWHFAPLPDLNRETKHRISKASAWPAFVGICVALRQEGRAGRTQAVRQAAKESQRVGIGLRHLARDMGLDVSTVRRQVKRLADLGLVVAHRPNVQTVRDHLTGRIITKSKGRCESTVIYLTITADHLRPAKAGTGAKRSHPPAGSKVQSATTVRDSGKHRTPDGGAAGVGTPPARQEAGLPAGQNRLPAAEAPTPVIPADAGRDEPPLPAGRIVPAAKAATAKAARSPFPEDHAEPKPFTGQDADRFAATRRRLEAERQAREAQASASVAEITPAAPQAPPPPPAPDPTFDQDAARAAVLAALGVT